MNGVRDLTGVRVWLSGSIPDGDAAAAQSIRAFVDRFARAATGAGATIVHGSHPTIAPLLLEVADERARAGRPSSLVLAIANEFWSNAQANGIEPERWQQLATVEVIPPGSAQDPGQQRQESLQLLRAHLAGRTDVVVAFGGKWWPDDQAFAGVPRELLAAMARGLPCFLLGGLGGATAGYVIGRPSVLDDLRNGLDARANQAIAAEQNPGRLVAIVLEQIARLPIGPREVLGGRPFRILALGGGGLRGAFTAAVLACWDEELRRQQAPTLTRHFDLVAGTSTGGILALGLAQGIEPGRMLAFYRDQGPSIFPLTSLARRWRFAMRSWLLPKFGQTALHDALRDAFATAPEGLVLKRSAWTRLLVPAYNATTDTPIVYGTQHREGMPKDDNVVSIAMGTAAAPSYFAAKLMRAKLSSHEAIDGGLWANNPSLVALAEAIGPLRIPIERIRLLSIGTTFGTERVARTALGLGGKLGWAAKIAGLLLKAQEQGVAAQCQAMLRGVTTGHGDAYVPVNRPSPDTAMDDPRHLAHWIALGDQTGRQEWSRVKASFLDGVQAPAWP